MMTRCSVCRGSSGERGPGRAAPTRPYCEGIVGAPLPGYEGYEIALCCGAIGACAGGPPKPCPACGMTGAALLSEAGANGDTVCAGSVALKGCPKPGAAA